MATYYTWNPFGVALEIAASGTNVVRKTATQFTVTVNAEWKTYYNGAATNYGMDVTSGGQTKTISSFGTSRSSGSISFTGTYSISGNGAATKTITVAFRNYNNDNGKSATKNVTFNVSVPAWTSYVIKYNANGGTGAPANQTKWKDQALTLSSTKPTRTGYSFLGWSTSSTATSATYSAGGSYPSTSNAAVTLYAVWKANTYTVKYNANGGTGAPGNQTKTYGQTLTLSTTKPTRLNYNFKGWGTSASATTATYASGGSYTANAAITLYAVWELAYVKPTLSNITVERCDSDGVVTDEGTYARINFDWSTFKTATEAAIEWVSNEDGAVSNLLTISLSGTSGTVLQIVGDGELNTDLTYSVTLKVSDSSGTTIISKTLSGFRFPIDVLNGEVGVGVSIGKPAEKKDVFEVALNNEFLGSTKQIGNSYSYSSTGTSGATGYIRMASISIIETSANWPITFIFNRRKALSTMTVHMTLENSTETTSTISTFVYEGSNYGAFVVQTSPLVWDLYVQKANANDTITLQEWYTSTNMDKRIAITFPGDMVTTVPNPYHRATPAKLQGLLDYIYPVGSIYISYSHVNPGTMFGGTWTRMVNTFLWGCDADGDIGVTGGEKTHTLTTNEMPSHTHGAVYSGNVPEGTAKNLPWLSTGTLGTGDKIGYAQIATGGGAGHNNMPPYTQVAIWRRTA